MQISHAVVAMESQYRYREERVESERLEVQLGNPAADQGAPESRTHAVTVEVTAPPPVDLSTPVDAKGRLQMLILRHLYESMTGRRLVLNAPEDLPASMSRAKGGERTLEIALAGPAPAAEGGVGVIYQRDSYYAETEAFSFATRGVVRTRDGREIAFDAALHMSREYVEQSSLTITAGNVVMTDPLVVNFDGLGAQLDNTHFAFDLDSDGSPEQIASLKPGSGYLALDKNADGRIGSGSELWSTDGQGVCRVGAI